MIGAELDAAALSSQLDKLSNGDQIARRRTVSRFSIDEESTFDLENLEKQTATENPLMSEATLARGSLDQGAGVTCVVHT